jgi:hypothetical protein
MKRLPTALMQNVTHLDDFVAVLINPLWTWQDLQPFLAPDQSFFKFCDASEVQNEKNAGVDGWGLDVALPAFDTWIKYVKSSSRKKSYSRRKRCMYSLI